MARSVRCDAFGFTWLGLVAMSLVALLLLARSRRQALAFWALVVAVLGPVGLLAWLIAARGRRTSAFVEAVGDLAPYVIGVVAAFLAVILVPAVDQNSLLQILAFYGIPLFVGLLFYQSPLLARAMGSSYVRTVLRRLPTALVSTNLALAGLWAISLPLIKWHLDYCGFSALTVLSWEGVAVIGALGGGLLLYAYHAWAVRRGFASWSALLWDNDSATPVSSPPWRRLWLWIVLSFVILVAGMVLGAIGIALASGVR
jgi:hypothetical protein